MLPPSQTPTVSVVIPVHNGEALLGQTLDSVLAQTAVVLETWVVDDGSTDGTCDVALTYAKHGVRLMSQRQAGPVAARNRGIELARGEFVALLDADDLWRPDKLARQIDVLSRNPELAGVLTLMQNFWDPGFEHEAAGHPELAAAQPGGGSALMLRRSVWQEVGPLDCSYQDRDIQEWLVRADHHGYAHETIEDVLIDRRIHGSNRSRSREDSTGELLALADLALRRRRARA